MFHKIISLMVGKREKRGGRSAWTLCSGLPLWIARQKRRARRAQARQPRTTLSSLLPTLYSTEAHCIVATHYPLLPSPYSLLNGSTLLFQGKREKRGGRSAWTLCSGLPLWIARHPPREARPSAPATHYPLLPSPYSLLPSFAISPHDNTVHIMSCITCGMFGVKRAETNHNYLICNKL